MIVKSKDEIDFKRLLKKCHYFVDKHINTLNENNWRLEKYIQALNERLEELKQLNVCPINETDLSYYTKKVDFLNGLIDSQKLWSSSDRLMATQILCPFSSDSSNGLKSDKTKEIHLNVKTKAENDIRSELFSNQNDSNNWRKRNLKQNDNLEDFEAVIKHHHSIQERVAEEMLELAHNLKHNCWLSNDIIKKDTQSLQKTVVLAERNTDSLKQNTNKIGDFVRRSCQYWLWIMLFIVSFTFLWIVVFIRLFPKKY